MSSVLCCLLGFLAEWVEAKWQVILATPPHGQWNCALIWEWRSKEWDTGVASRKTVPKGHFYDNWKQILRDILNYSSRTSLYHCCWAWLCRSIGTTGLWPELPAQMCCMWTGGAQRELSTCAWLDVLWKLAICLYGILSHVRSCRWCRYFIKPSRHSVKSGEHKIELEANEVLGFPRNYRRLLIEWISSSQKISKANICMTVSFYCSLWIHFKLPYIKMVGLYSFWGVSGPCTSLKVAFVLPMAETSQHHLLTFPCYTKNKFSQRG